MYQPSNLTILTTDHCTAKCDHCCVNSSPTRKDKLTADQMITAIDSVADSGDLKVVVFAGGEPTTLRGHLLDAIAHACDRGLNTRIVTNASWAKSAESAKAMLLDLREAGLQEVNISLDDFHEPFIAKENVKHAFQASKGMGFGAVSIATHRSPKTKTTPKSIMELVGEKLPVSELTDSSDELMKNHVSEDGTIYFISTGMLQKIGRGSETLSDEYFNYFELSQLSSPCHYYANNCALSPRNTLLSCCGIEANHNEILDFGSLEQAEARELLKQQEQNIVGVGISKLGPARLASIAKEIDPFCGMREKYTSVCHVCEDLTTNKKALKALTENKERVAAEIAIKTNLGST